MLLVYILHKVLFSIDILQEFDTHTIMDDLKAKREALDIAIADINSAIQHSKQVSMESPYAFHMDSVEPVWIPRYFIIFLVRVLYCLMI